MAVRQSATDPAITGALAEAAGATARLDEAFAGHPLERAFLHRARLDAVHRQAAVYRRLIDPWPLAAVLEGLRLRMAGEPTSLGRLPRRILDGRKLCSASPRWCTAIACCGMIPSASIQRLGLAHQPATPLSSAIRDFFRSLDRQSTCHGRCADQSAHLVEHLQPCGCCIMKGPIALAQSASHHPPPGAAGGTTRD
jgi:hypothetical protein